MMDLNTSLPSILTPKHFQARCVSVCGIYVFAEDGNTLRSFLIG